MAIEIPLTAKAAVLNEIGNGYVLVEDYPVKQPSELAPGECLIKLDYSGVCHSDIHIQRGTWPVSPELPVVGGHEGVGHVVAIGEHSTASIKIGDRVGVKWIGRVCANCEMCRNGHDSGASIIYELDGTFAEYVVSYINYVTPIPDALDSAAAAPILCAGLTVFKALKQARLAVGSWVSISGAGGGLGHLAIQYAAAMGYRVLAIDSGEEKKELCLKVGADKWLDFRESKDLTKDVQDATDGLGPHAAMVTVGDPRPYNQALMYLRPTGTLMAVGLSTISEMLNIPIALIVGNNLRIQGNVVGNRQDVTEALQLAAQGKVKCHHELRDLNDLNAICSDLAGGKTVGRVVVKV
ncbi:mannitol-1-phosphate dehydrogenase M1PDH1 [Tricholoma matsutake]|nr:mannitol-1-phosphate dehydrogenase M1PDH1 [Tricholoma matsutake 945]